MQPNQAGQHFAEKSVVPPLVSQLAYPLFSQPILPLACLLPVEEPAAEVPVEPTVAVAQQAQEAVAVAVELLLAAEEAVAAVAAVAEVVVALLEAVPALLELPEEVPEAVVLAVAVVVLLAVVLPVEVLAASALLVVVLGEVLLAVHQARQVHEEVLQVLQVLQVLLPTVLDPDGKEPSVEAQLSEELSAVEAFCNSYRQR